MERRHQIDVTGHMALTCLQESSLYPMDYRISIALLQYVSFPI